MINCLLCGAEMIWCDEYTFENLGMEGTGVVTNLKCTECSASADFYSN